MTGYLCLEFTISPGGARRRDFYGSIDIDNILLYLDEDLRSLRGLYYLVYGEKIILSIISMQGKILSKTSLLKFLHFERDDKVIGIDENKEGESVIDELSISDDDVFDNNDIFSPKVDTKSIRKWIYDQKYVSCKAMKCQHPIVTDFQLQETYNLE